MRAHYPRLIPAFVSLLLCTCGGGSSDPPVTTPFSIAASPSTLAVVPGSSNAGQLTVTPHNGFAGQVQVTLTRLPSGVTVSPNPFQLQLSGGAATQPITVSATLDAQIENVSVTATASSGNQSASTNIALQVEPISVTTWHYDVARTGVNSHETVLNLANVNPNTFGKLFTLPVDGAIVGEALYLPNVAVKGQGLHNVVFAATMHDSVYAFDADKSGSPLWQVSLLPQGATPVPMSVQQCQGVTEWTEVGVVSTPVIDPTTGTLYVVAKSYENGNPVFRVHALDVTSGREKLGGPVIISATYTLNGQTDTFSPLAETNRPALLFINGHIYVAFGSNGCNDFNSRGWILSYNAATLALEGTFSTEPGKSLAAIWLKGAGLSADSNSHIYAETGGGYFSAGTNFGTSLLQLTQSGTALQLVDWFTPYDVAYLSQNDLDLNDAVLLLPDQPGAHTHLAIGVGKEGTLYLVDRDNMGHFCNTCTNGDTQIVQELPSAVGKHTGSLVYWNSTVYSTGSGSPIMAWPVQNGLLSTPSVQTPTQAGGHSPVLTSAGPANGILWQINGSNLTAYNAATLVQLYVTSQTNGRDDLPAMPHFSPLTVVNGKVYISTNDSIVVLGLF